METPLTETFSDLGNTSENGSVSHDTDFEIEDGSMSDINQDSTDNHGETEYNK
jgi:hypothetical protein